MPSLGYVIWNPDVENTIEDGEWHAACGNRHKRERPSWPAVARTG